MTKDEAMDLALEALDIAQGLLADAKSYHQPKMLAAYTAIKQALAAQPAAQTVGEVGTMPGTTGFTMACFKAEDVPIGTKLYTTPPAAQPAPVQEPVPEGSVSKGEFNRLRDDYNDLVDRSQQDAKDATRWRKHVNHCQLQGVDLDYQITTPPAAQPAAPVQDGWKSVPEDPTNAMLRAVDRVDFTNADTDGTTINVWQAMLAAAPEKGNTP